MYEYGQTLPPFGGQLITPTACEDKSIIRADTPESVLDGRLGEISQRRLAHFPIAYSWGALVTAAGALIPHSNGPLRTNLYWCPVGPQGSGKSQPRNSFSPSRYVAITRRFAEGQVRKR